MSESFVDPLSTTTWNQGIPGTVSQDFLGFGNPAPSVAPDVGGALAFIETVASFPTSRGLRITAHMARPGPATGANAANGYCGFQLNDSATLTELGITFANLTTLSYRTGSGPGSTTVQPFALDATFRTFVIELDPGGAIRFYHNGILTRSDTVALPASTRLRILFLEVTGFRLDNVLVESLF